MVSFPDEILLNIFNYLPVKHLLKAREVCKEWKRVAEDNSIWYNLLQMVQPDDLMRDKDHCYFLRLHTCENELSTWMATYFEWAPYYQLRKEQDDLLLKHLRADVGRMNFFCENRNHEAFCPARPDKSILYWKGCLKVMAHGYRECDGCWMRHDRIEEVYQSFIERYFK
jgi:hypothetical protein